MLLDKIQEEKTFFQKRWILSKAKVLIERKERKERKERNEQKEQ